MTQITDSDREAAVYWWRQHMAHGYESELLEQAFARHRIQSTTAMAAEIERLKTEVERLYLDGIHTCSDECQRVACVQRREIEQLRTEKAALEKPCKNCGFLPKDTD